MSDTKSPESETSDTTPVPTPSANVHERPEVKPLVDKAGADPDRRVPQGTMKTGGDVPGGGGTQSLELPEVVDPAAPAPDSDTGTS